MAAFQKLATVLLLWNAFVISAGAQGQVVMSNGSSSGIWLDRDYDGNTNGPNDTLLAGGPNSQVAIYAAEGNNQPEDTLILQTDAKTNLFIAGRFNGGTRTLNLPPGPATVQVRVWTGPYPSYEAAQNAMGGDPGVITGRSVPLNITLTLSPTPAPLLTGAGFQGILLSPPVSHSSYYVRWGNTSETGIYTNDCSGPIAPISGTGAFRFGLYVGPSGAPAQALTLAALTTNSAVPGLFGSSNPTAISYQLGSGTFQVRGWPLSAGTTFEQAITNPVPGLVGVSDLGYFAPGYDIFSAPLLFGTGPGQVSGFELKGFCPSRMTPNGPLKLVHIGRDNTITWSNIANTTSGTNGTYRLYAASEVAGPYTNWSTVTANTAQITFTNLLSGPSLFFKLEWIDAPPPQPVGLWDYQAFYAADALMAAGNFTFTSNVPSTVTRSFMRIQNSGPANLHPSGVGTGQAQSIGSPNMIEMVYSSEFRLRGQMVGDYYAGDWFATDYLVWTPENPPPPGTTPFVLHTGRFVARRRF